MDSLYEPVPEHQEAKDTATPPESQATTPVSTHVSCGPPDRSMSLVSNISLQSMQCIHSCNECTLQKNYCSVHRHVCVLLAYLPV